MVGGPLGSPGQEVAAQGRHLRGLLKPLQMIKTSIIRHFHNIGACVKLVIVIVTIKYSIVTTFKEYVVINTVTTFSSCKSIISTHSCCNRTDRL